ncbi:MAG: hypothetical protein HYZ71_10050 [Deltaproteobacteria bacterium]|nr:hypothetical protein [Deltaproteobacteria bacterium]
MSSTAIPWPLPGILLILLVSLERSIFLLKSGFRASHYLFLLCASAMPRRLASQQARLRQSDTNERRNNVRRGKHLAPFVVQGYRWADGK